MESPDQLQTLTSTLRGYSPVPLLVAIDQEGGWVSRLPSSFGITTNDPGPVFGTQRAPAHPKAQGASTAQRLAELGINLNWPPSSI